MWYKLITYIAIFAIIFYPVNNSRSFESYKIEPVKEYKSIKTTYCKPKETQANSLKESIKEPAKDISLNNLKNKKFLTEINEEELKEVLAKAHIAVFHKPASAKRIHMAYAQIAFENGKGKKVYNYNLGNIGGNYKSPTEPYYKVAGSRFKSFNSFYEGAIDYWLHLKSRCSMSLNYFDAGDPYTASISLKNCGYFRADLKFYQKNLSSLYYQSIKGQK